MSAEEKKQTIADNLVVSIDYKLTIEDELVDYSEDGEPMLYLHGHQNIIPGLENALLGKKVGDAFSITIPPEEAYGFPDEENIMLVKRSDFPKDIPLEVGIDLQVRDEDDDLAEATIVWVGEKKVQLDFNHPLAGKTLTFDIVVVDIREATVEELDHGHAHEDDHHHH